MKQPFGDLGDEHIEDSNYESLFEKAFLKLLQNIFVPVV